MTHSDAAFAIGKTHKVCQDYAITGGASDSFPSVWLSDGCSSSPHTDIGARLLTHNALARVSELGAILGAESGSRETLLDEVIRNTLLHTARIVGNSGMTTDCLNATLQGLLNGVDREGERSVGTVFYGDGALVYGLTNGERVVYRVAYPANFPYYPAYLADAKRRAIWERVTENRQKITRTILDAGGGVRESGAFCPDHAFHWIVRPVTGLRWAAVLSDGIESFQRRGDGEDCRSFVPVDYLDVVRELTAFKNFAGEFVHRRLQSFLKECARRDWHHNDDISVAALCFGDGEREG